MIKKTIYFILVAVLSLAALLWGLLQSSLPQYTGKAELDGLNAPVTIERDQLGSATLKAASRMDLVQALGYVHAQERFFEMDLMRRRAAGELSELFGAATLPADKKVRRYRMRQHARQTLTALPINQQKVLAAYTHGVNQGLNALTTDPFVYLLTQTTPRPWRSEDSLLVALSMFLTLNESSIMRELSLSTLHAALPESAYQFLTATGGKWDAALDDSSYSWPPIPTVQTLDFRTSELEKSSQHIGQDHDLPGSNSFAVGGTLTGGPAIVANDMHLMLRVPNIWFRTRLIYAGQAVADKAPAQHDITGITLPGLPMMIIGSNSHIAWSFTNSYGDFADWVRLDIDSNDPTRYRDETGWQSLQIHEETIRVRNAPDEKLTVQETKWGPIIATDHDQTPLALAWTALKPGGINLGLIELEQAQSADDAAKIAQHTGMPAQNFIVGDQAGNIIWTIAGRIPARTGQYDPQLPSDWTQADVGWTGWLPPEQYPIVRNPASHRLWSANARMMGGEAFKHLGDGGYDLGARAGQIRDGLLAKDDLSERDLYAIQLDHRALFLKRWYRLLEAVVHQSNDTKWKTTIQLQLQDWDGQAVAHSKSYLLVRTFRQQVIAEILQPFAAIVQRQHPDFTMPRLGQVEHAVWTLLAQQPAHLLPPGYTDWDDFLFNCVKLATQHIDDQIKTGQTKDWGTYQQAQIHHPVSRVLPASITDWLNMPADALSGDHFMPRVQSPNFGASQRSVVAPGRAEQGIFSMPGGQSGHPLSPYYGSGHADWVNGQPSPFLPGVAEQQLTLN